jgi:hypothetical protein
LATLANNSFGTSLTSANIDQLALVLFNSPSLPGQPGKWLIPNDSLTAAGGMVSAAHLDNAFIPGTGYFTGDLAVADLDYDASKRDTLSLKYFYQHDPTLSPYSYSPRRLASCARRTGATMSSPSARVPFPAAQRAPAPSTSSDRATSPAFPFTTYWVKTSRLEFLLRPS